MQSWSRKVMETKLDKRPARILVGVFPDPEKLTAARRGLADLGIGEKLFGISYDRARLLSVMVPYGKEDEIVAVLRANGAMVIGEPAELALSYKIPHPGAFEDQGLKLPEGGEYPEIGETAVPRVTTKVLDPKERINHFDEIDQGFSGFAEAWSEANRCLQCPKPRCREGCPVHNDIPGFIRALLEGNPAKGIQILRQTTNFPGICGRVCDHPRLCEGACILAQEGNEPVAIGALERFLADWELNTNCRQAQAAWQMLPSGKRVAIVGSGPSGLAAAGDLALAGHEVIIYEALPVAGGALAWGIPTFRLPQHVLQAELDFLSSLGVEFKLNTKVGKDLSLDDLLIQYDAVFLGVGTTVSATLGLPGEDLKGIYTATEFLAGAKLAQLFPGLGYKLPEVGRRLLVFGAGNTAMDVAQTALRLGVVMGIGVEPREEITDVAHTALRLGLKEVTVVYRRSEKEMPARREEVESARREGVRFQFLTAPVRFIGDEKGRVQAVECIKMELGEPDERGRRRPVPKLGSEFILEADTVVLALGYRPDPELTQALDIAKDGLIKADPQTGRTGRPRLWAGGDIISGPASVVEAMRAGKAAAKDIDRTLKERKT